jgi:hypothetical protein
LSGRPNRTPFNLGALTGQAAGGELRTVPELSRIVSVQCFLARTVLGWSGRKLAKVAGVSAHTVANFERGDALKTSTVEVIQRTLEKAGIIFIDAKDGGPGARLRSQGTRASSARSVR